MRENFVKFVLFWEKGSWYMCAEAVWGLSEVCHGCMPVLLDCQMSLLRLPQLMGRLLARSSIGPLPFYYEQAPLRGLLVYGSL